ncbi:four helix bundle protein [Moraxella boevrei]|uniref:four helix bundle protein n=1 Tax=Faucicola boevrei TaxID=346665 RepID=UPI003735198F
MQKQPTLPPILRLAERLACECEIAVKGFDRYYKYTVGTDIRQQAMMIWRLANRAWLDKNHQTDYLKQLSMIIDDIKLTFLLAKRLKIFASTAQFEMLSLLTVDLGRQCGGWLKSIKH